MVYYTPLQHKVSCSLVYKMNLYGAAQYKIPEQVLRPRTVASVINLQRISLLESCPVEKLDVNVETVVAIPLWISR